MPAWLIERAINLALPYVIEFIFERLLDDDKKEKIEKEDVLSSKDVREVAHSWDIR